MKRKQKTKMVVFSIVSIVAACILFGAIMRIHGMPLSTDNETTHQPIIIYDSDYNCANNRQYESSVKMFAYNQKLYFYPASYTTPAARTAYYQNVSVFENGSAVQLERIEGTILGTVDQYVYYYQITDEFRFAHYCYDIETDTHYELVATEGCDVHDYYFTESGSLYVPLDKNREAYYPVEGNKVGDLVKQQEVYLINGRRFTLECQLSDTDVVCYSEADEYTSFADMIPYGQKSMIPCNDGLLIHNEGQGDLLYYIENETGEVIELYNVPCIVSESVVNVYGDDVYLSFKRYEKHGEIGLLRFEDDKLEGTYRISLEDYAVEKISDEIYSGLFIFDDTGIYACDEDCHIYKLDFDGNVIMTLFE